jgi:tellurite resistance protein TerC
VPAVFAISTEPFIVYSSNVFAILGMRALYLVLADLLRDLEYLKYGLSAILVLAGAKLLISGYVHVPALISLVSIVVILAAAIIPSVIVARRRRHEHCIT